MNQSTKCKNNEVRTHIRILDERKYSIGYGTKTFQDKRYNQLLLALNETNDFGEKKDIQKDDYFKRQEIDIKFRNELKINKKILKLTNKFGKKLKILACTSSSESVVKRIVEIKSQNTSTIFLE